MNKKMRHKCESKLHSTIMKLARRHKKVLRNEFYKVNLTEGKPKILDFLVMNPGCSQKDIAKLCHIEPATATSILSSMENEELIYRTRNQKDKRILNVFLTEKGLEFQRQVEKIFSDIDDICFEGFTEEEKAQSITYLNRINDNLRKGEDNID